MVDADASATVTSQLQPPTEVPELADPGDEIARLSREFDQVPADPHNRDWVLRKLKHIHQIDQLVRSGRINSQQMYEVDHKDTEDLRGLIKIHGWFTIDSWGEDAETTAYLVAQHSPDPGFRHEALERYEQLKSTGKVSLAHYALLYDRVAALDEGRPQRYGSQGRCVETGGWEPMPIEDAEHVDARRATMGLSSFAENSARLSKACP